MKDIRMSIEELKQMAATIRSDIIEMICTAAAGHPGGSLSAVEILISLYGHAMRHKPDQPDWEDRDRLIVSKGHCSPVTLFPDSLGKLTRNRCDDGSSSIRTP